MKDDQKIFTASHLLFDIDVEDMKDAFTQIAKKAKDLGVIKSVPNLVKALLEREKISTTGMSESFAIPHASLEEIKYPCVIAARFSEAIEWKSVDGKPVKFAICLLIPKAKLSSLHMKYLSRVASALLNQWFKDQLLTAKKPETVVRKVKKAITTEPKQVKQSPKKIEKDKKEVQAFAKAKELVDSKSPKRKLNIVGVTGCAGGIAHTFRARTALEKYADANNMNIWVETHGQDGQQHTIPEDLIKEADYVIIASDINIDTDRFFGKKVYKCSTNEAINTPALAFKNMQEKAMLVSAGSGYANPEALKGTKDSKFMKHFLSGVSHMIPVLVFSGIICAIITAVINGMYLDEFNAISAIIGKSFSEWLDANHHWAFVLQTVANVGFTLFTAVMGGYIADSIAGRSAFAPAMIASFVMGNAGNGFVWWWDGLPQQVEINWHNYSWIDSSSQLTTTYISGISLGIIAAIVMGFAAGYLVKLFLKIKVKPAFRPLMTILFIPVIGTSILVFPYVFLLSGVCCCAMNYIGAGIAIAGSIPGVNFLIGFLLGLMIGFDMGGPVNKIACSTATGLIAVDPRFMGACAAAIPIAPLATGICCVMFRKLFDEEDFKNGVTAIGLGCTGISEGAIPMFTKYPKQTFVANIIGGAVAGGLAFSFFCGGHVAMYGGPLSAACMGIYADPGQIQVSIPEIFGGTGSSAIQTNGMQYISVAWFFVAIAGGVAVECVVYYFMIKSFKTGYGKKLARLRRKLYKEAGKEIPTEQVKVKKCSYPNFLLNHNFRCALAQ